MMMQKRFAVLGALVCALAMLTGNHAQASYNYSTSLSVTSTTGGATFANSATGATVTLGGTTVTLTNVARTGFGVPSDNTVNIGDVAVTTTTAPPGTSFSFNYTDVISLTNVPPPGSAGTGSVTITGTITLSQVSTGAGIVQNAFVIANPPLTTVGGIPFLVTGTNFGNPTINVANGNLGGRILVVPEPTSIVTLGLGIGMMGIVGLRRRFRSA